VEKPSSKQAPSTLASIGRYVLTPDIFDILKSLSSGVAGEIQLSDAINLKAQRGVVNMLKLKGQRFDCGSVPGFVAATNHMYAKKYLPNSN
jgi:UTP--glucose-1-phosphate uridylyltransferase